MSRLIKYGSGVVLSGLLAYLVLSLVLPVKRPLTLAPHIQAVQPVVELETTNTLVISGTAYLPIIFMPHSTYLPIVFAPSPLLALNPPPNSREQSPNAYLQWALRDPAQTFVRYALYLEASNPQPNVLLASGLTKTNFDPNTFALDTQYYWRIVATDAQGQQVVGPVWSFKVEALPELPQLGAVVPVPAGEFLMGCDPARLPIGGCVTGKDKPLHPVYLDAYAIDKYEVTNLQYRTCVQAKVCRAPLYSTSKTRKQYFSNRAYDYHPVLFVAQEDARAYCQWVGGRLPTEAEWEKAARGPIDTRTWPWGEEFPNCARANFTDDRTRKWVICASDTTRVGSYPTGASPYGAMDMAGNVFEWVQDRMDVIYQINYYAISPYANPPGPQPRREVREGPFYVIRGGSYRPRWRYARVFHRHHGHRGGYSQLGVDIPLYRNDQVGFRCVHPGPTAAPTE